MTIIEPIAATSPTGSIAVSVADVGEPPKPIVGAPILVYKGKPESEPGGEMFKGQTDEKGQLLFEKVPPGPYTVATQAFSLKGTEGCTVRANRREAVTLKIPIELQITVLALEETGTELQHEVVTAGTTVRFVATYSNRVKATGLDWHSELMDVAPSEDDPLHSSALVSTGGMSSRRVWVEATLKDNPTIRARKSFNVIEKAAQPITGTVGVNLRRSATHRTRDQALWVAIRDRTRAISFTGYKAFIDRVLCDQTRIPDDPKLEREIRELGTNVHGVAAYELLKTATEVFLLLECGVGIDEHDKSLFDPDEEAGRLGLGAPITVGEIGNRLRDYLGDTRLPYIDRVVAASFPGIPVDRVHCNGVLTSRANGPCLLELIWSYWHEEGMLVQSINAVSRRFQNVRGPGDRDPLAHLEIDPLRPLNNLLWGHIQGEWNRLSVKRRAYEYDHHYGLTLYGKAVPALRPADSRSKFLEGFHNLLYVCSVFFKEDNDTTVIADGYPLLNALKEVHLLLAQGAHNQFGDLPWTARVEMLIQEWLLARPEMRDFLQSRAMVPYKEAWMPQVDTMKTLQGWSDVTVTHFRDLGVYGEQLLLSIRYADWIDVNDEDSAKNWARYWRPEIQGYLHGYRAVTGVDLTNPDTVDSTMPSVHLRKRLASQRTR